jgi:hypothetical protein
MVLYRLPAAGTAALVSQGLLLSPPGLDGAVQGCSGEIAGSAYLGKRVKIEGAQPAWLLPGSAY